MPAMIAENAIPLVIFAVIVWLCVSAIYATTRPATRQDEYEDPSEYQSHDTTETRHRRAGE